MSVLPMQYQTPDDPYSRDRSIYPYLCGDLFINSEGDELTLLQIVNGAAYCVLMQMDGSFRRVKFADWRKIFESGYALKMECLQKETELEGSGIYAPRQLKDGTWAGLTRLVSTTAICVDFSEITMYESRYCFSHTEVMNSWHLAAYWLAQFTSKESLPVGNCAFRGHLGTEPILPADITNQYYSVMGELRFLPTVNGMNIHQFASHTMAELLRAEKAIRIAA